ncbi:MAG: type IV conjugative transfer system protein TraL [Gammaproteobacteria bacterium]
MNAILMPRYLNEQMMVLLWSADELVPGFAVFIVGVLIEQKLIALILALVVVRALRKVKEGRPDGFLLHLLYWLGLLSTKSRSMPNPFIREYLS